MDEPWSSKNIRLEFKTPRKLPAILENMYSIYYSFNAKRSHNMERVGYHTSLMVVGVHVNILFNIKCKILVLVERSYRSLQVWYH